MKKYATVKFILFLKLRCDDEKNSKLEWLNLVVVDSHENRSYFQIEIFFHMVILKIMVSG